MPGRRLTWLSCVLGARTDGAEEDDEDEEEEEEEEEGLLGRT